MKETTYVTTVIDGKQSQTSQSKDKSSSITVHLLYTIQSEHLRITLVLGPNFRNIADTLQKHCSGNAANVSEFLRVLANVKIKSTLPIQLMLNATLLECFGVSTIQYVIKSIKDSCTDCSALTQ